MVLEVEQPLNVLMIWDYMVLEIEQPLNVLMIWDYIRSGDCKMAFPPQILRKTDMEELLTDFSSIMEEEIWKLWNETHDLETILQIDVVDRNHNHAIMDAEAMDQEQWIFSIWKKRWTR